MIRRFWVQIAVTAAAVVALAGCAGGDNPGATSATTTTPAGASWSRPDAPPDHHTLLRAAASAVAKVPNGTLVFIESETDDAGTWKIRVATPDGTEQQLKVNSDGVTVLVGPTPTNDSDDDKARRRADAATAHLDYRAAVDKMMAAMPNGSITKLDLDNANGTTVWEADVWDTYLVEHEVTINAGSGELIDNKQV